MATRLTFTAPELHATHAIKTEAGDEQERGGPLSFHQRHQMVSGEKRADGCQCREPVPSLLEGIGKST